MKQGKVRLFPRQERQKLAEGGQDSEPGIPAITVPDAEQRGLLYYLRWRLARRQLTVHGLGDDEAEIMAEPTPWARGYCPSPQDRRKLPSRSKMIIGCSPRLNT